MQNSVKLALIEQHGLLRQGLGHLLQVIGFSVTHQTGSAKDLIAILNMENSPDVIIADGDVPREENLETIQFLKRNYPSIKLLVIALDPTEELIIDLIRNGVNGYLPKGASHEEFKNAIHSVIKNHSSRIIRRRILENYRKAKASALR